MTVPLSSTTKQSSGLSVKYEPTSLKKYVIILI